MIRRHLTSPLLEALKEAPVVYLAGPRQCGKSTLARAIAEGEHPARYLSFDDLGLLAAARNDPTAFVRGLEEPVVLDEVQRCPEILLPLKAAVDRDRRPGRFFLTGSASVLALPAIADALVGRVEILSLRPLSQGEIEGREDRFVDALFGDAPVRLASPAKPDTDPWARLARGGFPEAIQRKDPDRRGAWFDSYVSTLLTRDVRDLAQVEGLTRLPDLLRLLAARTGGLLNTAEISRASQLPQTTLKRYLTLLEAVFLITRVPPWSANLGKRLVKSSRLYLADPGLAAHLRGGLLDEDPPSGAGPLLEGFAFAEIEKQIAWSRTRSRLHHFRAHAGVEVDFVLEDARGRCAGVEVKSSETVGPRDFIGLRRFAEAIGDRFHRGVVLYRGTESIAFGDRLDALPVQALWRARA